MVHLSDEPAERLRAEAARRNMSVDDVAAELHDEDVLEAFLGIGIRGAVIRWTSTPSASAGSQRRPARDA